MEVTAVFTMRVGYRVVIMRACVFVYISEKGV